MNSGHNYKLIHEPLSLAYNSRQYVIPIVLKCDSAFQSSSLINSEVQEVHATKLISLMQSHCNKNLQLTLPGLTLPGPRVDTPRDDTFKVYRARWKLSMIRSVYYTLFQFGKVIVKNGSDEQKYIVYFCIEEFYSPSAKIIHL